MNSKVEPVKVKVLVEPQHKDTVNCQVSEHTGDQPRNTMVT